MKIYEVWCDRCGGKTYIISDSKELHCPNCLNPLVFTKTIRPHELPHIKALNPSLASKVYSKVYTGKIQFCPIHLIPTTGKCPICGRKPHTLQFNPSNLSNLINLVTNNYDDEHTALEILLSVIIEEYVDGGLSWSVSKSNGL